MNRKLSADLQEKAIKELNEVPSRIEDDVKHIREWLSKEQHLKVKIDDDRILGFLRGCKYSLQKTKEKIDFHFTIRTLVPEFFHIRDPFAPEIQEIINAGCILPLPKPESKYGARIIMWNYKNSNPDTMPYLNITSVFNMILDVLLKEDDDAVVSGLIFWSSVVDCPAKYIIQMTPTVIKKNMKCMENAYPFRIKGTYIINCPSYFEFVFNVIKSCTKSKMAERTTVFSNINDFYKVLPQSLLPKEYGGENGSLEDIKAEWKGKLESYREWFLENRNYKSDECGLKTLKVTIEGQGNRYISLPEPGTEIFFSNSLRTVDLQEKAIKELNEVPSRIEDDVKHIREWLSKEQHLKVKIDDDRILGCLQRTKEKIDFHFTIRTLVPEFFYIRDPLAPEIQKIINAGCLLPLPKPELKYGARIIMWNFKNANPDTMPYLNLVSVFNMILDILLKEDDHAVISGLIFWSNIEECSVKYITQTTPTIMKKNLECMEKAYPFRIKGSYVINVPPYYEVVCNFIKSFTKSKVAQRMTMFSHINNFYEVLPQSLLPKEYGGENGTLEGIKAEWKRKLESHREWFLENRNYKSDECMRYGEPKTVENIFGVEGSFRKMHFD
ncbi:hypothetical protein FQA39_LY15916 [Lamprigera yunnana]|nr:hypothetical protein FQA39_LY15916 [Lamprigera yunnana]